MATFNINLLDSVVIGTAASDTFNIAADLCTVFGLDGDDVFAATGPFAILDLDGGAGNDSFNLSGGGLHFVRGGEGNDTAFIAGAAGDNNVSGGAGNDWIGIDGSGGFPSARNTLDSGDGDDFRRSHRQQQLALGWDRE